MNIINIMVLITYVVGMIICLVATNAAKDVFSFICCMIIGISLIAIATIYYNKNKNRC